MNTALKHIISIAIIIILICAAYSNSLDADWHFDDTPNILTNYSVHARSLGEIWSARNMNGSFPRYCGFVSFAFNWYFHEKDVTGYHVTNILIHAAVTVLVYCSVYLTLTLPCFSNGKTRTVWLASLFAACIWGLSPVHTQAVTYIVQRLTSLAALFFMLSFFLFIKGRRCMLAGSMRKGIVFVSAAVPVYMMAVLTKENTIMLPFLALLYEHLFLRRIRSFSDRRAAGLVLLLAVGYIFLVCVRPGALKMLTNISKGYEKREFTLIERVLTQFRVMVRYLTLIVFPHPSRLNLDYNFPISKNILTPVTTLFSVLFVSGSLIFAFLARNRYPLAAFCILWFYINNIVESTILPLEIIFEHRTYLPSVSIVFLLIVLLFRCADKDLGVRRLPV